MLSPLQLPNPNAGAAPVEVKLYTVAQAAAAYQLSERSIFRLIERGELSTVKIGSALRIHSDEIERFARTGTRENYAGVPVATLDPAGVVQAQ
jgi:excisionase family DNA binding protein